ncbi:hypothetical protein [Sphingomonas sp. PAMC 26605]|uniref:hypothetical protein n=1 Tax=Sphingomonas sp. PAMC 26605 TaxID=1112214 RepID=UPI00026CB212|nr:hypothetical protein [Sphingomonas sp. PAMC 26605]
MMRSVFVIATAAMFSAIGSAALAQAHVSDLMRENIANGIAFTAKYTGKSIDVDDYVVATSASSNGNGSISVGAKPDKFGFPPSATALCPLRDAQEIQTFSSLNKGAHIILTGKFSSMMGSTLMLTDCSYRLSAAK